VIPAASPTRVTVHLADGAPLLVRPVGPGDRDLIAAAYDHLSDTTRHRRFLSQAVHLSPRDLDYFTHVDHHRHEAMLAIDPRTDRLVGVVRHVRIPGTADAELSALVVDDWQRRGVARLLLRLLTPHARAEGIKRYVAIVDDSNLPVIGMLERAGAGRSRVDGVLVFTLSLDAISRSPQVLEHREHAPVVLGHGL
jgi:RimJ/RimL family protein N-acetyltransferase